MRKWLFWDLLTGVKIVWFYDIAMSIITVLFMLLGLLIGTGGTSMIFQFLDFIIVITPRTMMAFYIVRRMYPKRLWRISWFLRLITLLPSIVFEIIQLVFDSNNDNNSKGATIAFGIIFLIANIAFNIFWAYALWSYYKNGTEPLQLAAEAAIQANQAQEGNQNHNGAPLGFRPNQQQMNNFVAAKYNDEVLEGKDPQNALAKQYAEIQLSLNGGEDDNTPKQDLRGDPIGNQENEDFNDQDTPPDFNYHQNKVVERRPEINKGPSPFPEGRFT